MVGVSAQDVFVHIRKTWLKDMQHEPKIRECMDPPIHGALPGDEPSLHLQPCFGATFKLIPNAAFSFIALHICSMTYREANDLQVPVLHVRVTGTGHSAVQIAFSYAPRGNYNP